MADDSKEIDVKVKWSQEGAEQVGQTIPTQTANWRAYNKELESTETHYRSLRMAGRELGQVSREVTLAGTVLTAALVLDANNYVKTVGATTAIGAKWLANEERIKQANLEIGQTTAQVMLPAMEKVASLTESIAGIVQANPWMISGALTVGGILTAVGAIGFIVSRVITVIADLGLLLGKMGLTSAGAGAAGAGGGGAAAGAGGLGADLGIVTLTATSVVIGAELGSLIGNAIAKAIYGDTYKTQNVQDAFITMMKLVELPGLELAKAFQTLNPELPKFADAMAANEQKITEFVGKLIGASQYSNAPAAGGGGASIIPQQAVTEFTNYQQQLQQAEQTYEQQRADIIQSTEQQIADSTQQYEQQRTDIIKSSEETLARDAANFARQQQNALQSYNDQIARDTRNFREQEKNAARTHAREMQQLAAAHDQRIQDLIASRDALGLVKEQQSYTREVSDKNAQFREQQQQARQAFQNQLSDARQNYERQRQQAQEAYAQQVADEQQREGDQLARLDTQHQMEMAKLQQQEQDKLQKLDDSYKKQVDAYQKAFVDRINAIDSSILGDTAAYQSYLANQSIAFQQWISNFEAQNAAAPGFGGVSGSAGGFHSGGYRSFRGVGEDGLPEYVLSHQTTRTLEHSLGGKLTQAGVLSAILAGRAGLAGAGGPNAVNISIQSRSLTLAEIRYETEAIINQRLSDLIPAFGA